MGNPPSHLQFCCQGTVLPGSAGSRGHSSSSHSLPDAVGQAWACSRHPDRKPAHSHPSAEAGGPVAQTGKAQMGQTGPSNLRAAQNYRAFALILLPWRLSHWSRREVGASS